MNTRKEMNAALVVVALVAGGCAGSSKQVMAGAECPGGPSWTCMTSGKCPLPDLSDSLCAVGRADNVASEALGLEAASVRARGEIARVVEYRAVLFSRAIQDSMSQRGTGEDSIQQLRNLNQNVVGRTLNGVTVPRTYVNAAGVYYALAAIDAKTFATAIKSLKDASALSEATKQEIDRRADAIVEEWQREVERLAEPR